MLWLHSLKVAQLLRSAACLHANQSRSYLNHLIAIIRDIRVCIISYFRMTQDVAGLQGPYYYYYYYYYYYFGTHSEET